MTSLMTAPIGIFDSGIGGLTVAKTITEYLPNESIIYFGDTAHVPWGNKSAKTVQHYAIKICDVLLQHQCKLIVMACHTASTVAYEQVRAYVGERAHVINVVDPIIEHITTYHTNRKIGLIGTRQTIKSNIYQQRLNALNCNIELTALATPLLVPLIEEGFSEKGISKMAVEEYLSHPLLKGILTLILGCTHYPLLKQYIRDFYQNIIDIIDASEVTAKKLQEYLAIHKLLNVIGSIKNIFYVSDYNEYFENTAKLFFPGNIQLKHYEIER